MFVWQNDTNFIFLCLSKIWSMSHHQSVVNFRVKNATLHFHLVSWHFLLFFIIKFLFLSFLFLFFGKVYNFCNIILTILKQESRNCWSKIFSELYVSRSSSKFYLNRFSSFINHSLFPKKQEQNKIKKSIKSHVFSLSESMV